MNRDMKIAEAVRDAVKKSATVEYNKYACEDVVVFGEIDLQSIIASVEAPEPVGEVITTGGYPDESRREAEGFVTYKELPEGTKLYAEPVAPQPASAAAEPVSTPAAHMLIAGALYDFIGWLTARETRLVLSSADNAGPAAEAITEFAKMRGLQLSDAAVLSWQEAIAAAEAKRGA